MLAANDEIINVLLNTSAVALSIAAELRRCYPICIYIHTYISMSKVFFIYLGIFVSGRTCRLFCSPEHTIPALFSLAVADYRKKEKPFHESARVAGSSLPYSNSQPA